MPTAEGQGAFCRTQGIADAAPLPQASLHNRGSRAGGLIPGHQPGAVPGGRSELAAFLAPLARIRVQRHARGRSEQLLKALAQELPGGQRQAFL